MTGQVCPRSDLIASYPSKFLLEKPRVDDRRAFCKARACKRAFAMQQNGSFAHAKRCVFSGLFGGEMTNLLKFPTWADEDHVYAVVETPRGSTCKLDFDAKLRVFTLAKPLMTGLTYPYDWGFIP